MTIDVADFQNPNYYSRFNLASCHCADHFHFQYIVQTPQMHCACHLFFSALCRPPQMHCAYHMCFLSALCKPPPCVLVDALYACMKECGKLHVLSLVWLEDDIYYGVDG